MILLELEECGLPNSVRDFCSKSDRGDCHAISLVSFLSTSSSCTFHIIDPKKSMNLVPLRGFFHNFKSLTSKSESSKG